MGGRRLGTHAENKYTHKDQHLISNKSTPALRTTLECYQADCHLVQFLGETLNAVDIDTAVIHDGHNMSAVGADRHCGDCVVMGTHVEEQLAGVNVDEAHHAVLAQYTKRLRERENNPQDGQA